MIRVVFPARHRASSGVEIAGVVELLGVVSSEGCANGAAVEEPGLQHDGVVPGVAVNARGVPRVWRVIAHLGNTENTHLTRLHLPAALAPDVSVWVGSAGQLKPGPALVFVFSAGDPVRNPSSPGLVARGRELEKTLHLAGVSKIGQLVVEVWTMPVPPREEIRRRERRTNWYLTLWRPRTG